MRILTDQQIFSLQQYGGISRYFSEVIKGINQTPGFQTIPKKIFSNNQHLVEKKQAFFPFLKSVNKLYKGRVGKHINKIQRRKEFSRLKRGEFDVFHPTYYDTEFLEFINPSKPFVITVHDMIHELYYNSSDMEQWESINKKKLIPLANHIIAVSKNTKDDILKLFPAISPERITVIYHGPSISVRENSIRTDKSSSKYILFVGKRSYYKNFSWLINSASSAIIEKDLHIICAGGGPFTEDEIQLLYTNRLTDRVSFTPIKNDDELMSLYMQALCLLYPSLYEGFGIPILEAFACGCPAIVCRSSCLPEVGGNAVLYFAKENPDELVQALRQITEDEGLRTHLIDAGYNRLKLFSWKKSVEQHCGIYQLVQN